jgi:hypothetical protein
MKKEKMNLNCDRGGNSASWGSHGGPEAGDGRSCDSSRRGRSSRSAMSLLVGIVGAPVKVAAGFVSCIFGDSDDKSNPSN